MWRRSVHQSLSQRFTILLGWREGYILVERIHTYIWRLLRSPPSPQQPHHFAFFHLSKLSNMSYITGPRQPPPSGSYSRATGQATTDAEPTVDISRMSANGKKVFMALRRQLQDTSATDKVTMDLLNARWGTLFLRERGNITVQSRQTPSRPSDGGSTQRPDDKSHQA